MIKFYYDEFEEKCLSSGWNYTKELLLRRKELKNQSSFLATVTISIATGVVAGLLANNIYKFSFLMSSMDDSAGIIILKLITIVYPIIGYTEEIEIEIIEKLIRERLAFGR